MRAVDKWYNVFIWLRDRWSTCCCPFLLDLNSLHRCHKTHRLPQTSLPFELRQIWCGVKFKFWNQFIFRSKYSSRHSPTHSAAALPNFFAATSRARFQFPMKYLLSPYEAKIAASPRRIFLSDLCAPVYGCENQFVF